MEVGWMEVLLGFLMLVTILGVHLVLVSRWAGKVEDRVERLFQRDERLFEDMRSMRNDIHEIREWVAHQKGIEEGRKLAREET